jgi:predicted glycosyltransferase
LLKASAQGAKIWAVAGYPLLVGKGSGWREKILELYEKIIIFAPLLEKDMMAASYSNERDRKDYNDFFERHKDKIVFAGYLLPQGDVLNYKDDVNIPKPAMAPGACQVAVVRGGGAYYPKIIAEAIRASEFLGKEYYFTVIAGPSTTPEEWYFFSTLIAKKKVKNAALHKSIVDYEGLIRESDICVATASYHTAAMLLKYKKKAVIVPFEGYSEELPFQEQPARAVMLQEMIGANTLRIKDLTAVGLADLIKSVSHGGTKTVGITEDWFTGQEYLDKALTGLSVR